MLARRKIIRPIRGRISHRSTYVFGPYRLDTARRLLYLGSVAQQLPERLFKILMVLIETNGIVDREKLAIQVWGDEGVTDTNLNQHVYMLRLMLGERKGGRSFIITVPGEGYQFVAPVSVEPEDERRFIEDTLRAPERVMETENDLLQLYCRASYLLEWRTADSLRGAINTFEATIGIDDKYVPSYIGLARAHALLAEYWHAPPDAAFRKAKAAIVRALRLEPRSYMAHAVLSEIRLFADWDWSKARRSILTAMTLNPQSTFVRNNAAWYYVCRGDLSKALTEARQALVLEPSSLPLQLLKARVLLHAGDYATAVSDLTNIVNTDSSFYLARRYRAQANILNGKPSAAIEDLAAERDFAEDLSFRLPMLGRAYAELDDPQAELIYDRLVANAKTHYVPSWNLALVAAALKSRRDEALDHLMDAYRDREPALLFLNTLPWFESIKRRRTFTKLVRKVASSGSRGVHKKI